MSLIDPNLLQLIGLGADGDSYIADGRHLRWLFHPLLGFPRSGFRLLRRPSLLTIDFDKPPPGAPPVRSQLTRQAELGVGSSQRFASGLSVSKAGGFVYGPAASGDQLLLRLDEQPVSLDFGGEGLLPPTSGELLSNPAAYVVLTIARRARSGFVVARGFYDGRPTLRAVDRAAVGGDLRVHLADLAGEIATVGTATRALSFGERLAGANSVARRDARLANWLIQRRLQPRWQRPPRIADPNPFVAETLLLHGGLLEHIDIHGHDANLLRVQWISTRDLFAAPGWTELERFYLPLTDAPELYPAWTTIPGEKVAAQRLLTSPPKRQPPWDREDGGNPPILLPTTSTPVAASLDARYLGAEFAAVDAAMREFLAGELLQLVPQSLVQVTERLEPEPGDESGPESVDVAVSPFDLLYGASADPQVARELGLATVDTSDPAGIYDYAVEAGFPVLWVQWVLQPKQARERADKIREGLDGKPADWHTRGPFSPFSIASVLTGLKQGAASALEAPADLRAEVLPDAGRSPVQARVRVTWERGPNNLFEEPQRSRVLHVFKRQSDAGDLLLHHRDDETKLLAPHLPTPYGEPDARLNLVDRAIPAYGTHTWKVAALDLFGRLSPDAAVVAEVRDTLAPPAPANAEAALLGDATDGPAWTGLTIAFDWLPAHAAQTPDLARFEVHLRQGPVGTLEANLPATWGKLETTPGAIAGPLLIEWPSLSVNAVPPGVSANVLSTPISGGGLHITVELSPIGCPFNATGYARLAAAVRALDDWGNASGFAVARAERVDLAVPPPPTFAENALRATLPDAQNRSWFRVPLPATPGASARVLRAAGVALLKAASADPAAFAALSEPEQVGMLKSLAVAQREPFATDHEQPLPADGGAHLLELVGTDRGFTVIHVAMENRNGTRSGWPTSPAAFLVVTLPRTVPPPPPLVAEVRVGDRSATLWVAPDVTATTRRLALYRTRKAQDAEDVRRMKPVLEIELPQPAPAGPTPLLDSGLYDDVDYFYRVVAIGDDELRSAPSMALRAMPIALGPPPPPEIQAIERDAAQPDRRLVHLLVSRRDYRVFLFRRRRFAPDWETTNVAALGPKGELDFAALPSTPDPAGYQVVVEDSVPSPDEAYSYFARIEDPRGRTSASAPLLESV